MAPFSSIVTSVTLYLLYPLSLFPLALATVKPRVASWSSEGFGPDGPWNAVEVSVGGQPKIALFPGHVYDSFVVTSDYCAFNNSVPHCVSGTYLKDRAIVGSSISSTPRISWMQPDQEFIAGIEVVGSANLYLDELDMLFETDSGLVENHAVALIESESQMLVYPDGTHYPIFTGCLSVGAPEALQIFESGSETTPGVNASMIPWALKSRGSTASSSFGLHYGSASPSAKVPGSFVFGGYDRSRVIGNPLSLDADLRNAVTLKDISISIISGSSPFPSAPSPNTTIPDLLRHSNTTIPRAGLPVVLDACSPYFTLPQSTCDAIAAHLPVTFHPDLGLYLWNTTSPLYPLVVSSASALSFTFMGVTNTEFVTVHVPFRHLNLTLTAPLAPRDSGGSVPYFPCFTGGSQGGSKYALGRAFFQDAFVGANWETGTAWLAQAPGPNIPTGFDVVEVKADAETIEAGKNEWELSWDGIWRALTDEEVEAALNGDADDGQGGASGGVGITGTGEGGGDGGGDQRSGGGGGSQGSGLSTGATAGIGVGAAVGGMALVAAVGLVLWRRRAARLAAAVPPPAGPPSTGPESTIYSTYDSYAEVKPPVEAPAWMPAEAPTENRVYEMPGGQQGGGYGSWVERTQ